MRSNLVYYAASCVEIILYTKSTTFNKNRGGELFNWLAQMQFRKRL